MYGAPEIADRILIAGQSGSGKGYLMTAIVSRWEQVAVIDSKGDPKAVIPNAKVTGDWREAVKALPGRVVYQPPRHEMRDHRKKVDAIIDRVLTLGYMGAAVHELNDAADESSEGEAPAVFELFRKGRFYAVPSAVCTQRPKRIPLVCRTEASIAVTFVLIDPDDRDTMAAIIGPEVRTAPLALPFDRSFYVRDQRGRIQLVKGGIH